MKRISKKFGIFAAIMAGLLVFALAACFNPVDPSETFGEPHVPAEGMGAVRLNVNRNIARSILPTGVPTIATYTAVFNRDGNVIDTKTGLTSTTISNPIDLPPGTGYTVTITGHITEGAVARGTSAAFVVEAGVNNTTAINVTLEWFVSTVASETGNFTYDITLPAGLSTATMTITQAGGAAVTPTPGSGGYVPNLLTSAAGDVTLAPGYYSVLFTLNDGTATVVFRQILHVYQFQTSDFTHTFTGDHFVGPEFGSRIFGVTDPTTAPDNAGFNLAAAGDFAGSLPEITVDVGDTATVTSALPGTTWEINGVEVTGNTTLTIVGGTGNFEYEGYYDVGVFATVDTVPFSTFFRVIIED